MYELIPYELKMLPNWVCWKAEPNAKSHSGISKKPINPKTGGLAQSNNPSTWSDFDTALRMSDNFAGIGFMFSGSGYFGVDIDDTGEQLTEYLEGRADSSNVILEFIDTLQSYAELSQSGNGIHIICKGKLPEGARRKGKFEMYDKGRFFVMTGNMCCEYADIPDCTEKIKPLHKKYLGSEQMTFNTDYKPQYQTFTGDVNEIIEKASKSANGEKFRKLMNGDWTGYTSQSDADMALCSILAFWCSDSSKVDEIFRQSGLMRDKWDRKTGDSTYGAITISKALSTCRNHYGENFSKSDNYSVSVGTPKKYHTFDDTGNSKRLIDKFGDIIKYSYIDKRWLYYKDGKWNYDNLGYIRTLTDKVVEDMVAELPHYQSEDEKNGSNLEKDFMKHLKKSRNHNVKTNMIKETEHLSSILPSMLDRHKHLINCKNGILNLKTGEFTGHSKDKYITKITQCNYNPNAETPARWLEFLDEIFSSDKEMIRYVQKAIGYSLSGSTMEQCAFFLYGTGRNGKSTFLEIIRYIMGEYATNIQPQTIMVKPNTGNAPTGDIARLKGARLVTSVEPNEGMKVDEGLLKQLTGDDIVTARKMFSEEFEFKPEFKLFMATNHKPVIRGTDTGIWRRIHLIPFEVQIPEDKIDRHLKYKLAKEYEGIFKWAVEGCMLWQKEGLKKPAKVEKAVAEYRHEMDVIASFIDACCIDGQGSEKASVLYAVYCRWASENNEYKMSSTKFGAEMSKRFEKSRTKQGIIYNSISLMDCNPYSISIG